MAEAELVKLLLANASSTPATCMYPNTFSSARKGAEGKGAKGEGRLGKSENDQGNSGGTRLVVSDSAADSCIAEVAKQFLPSKSVLENQEFEEASWGSGKCDMELLREEIARFAQAIERGLSEADLGMGFQIERGRFDEQSLNPRPHKFLRESVLNFTRLDAAWKRSHDADVFWIDPSLIAPLSLR